MSTIKSSDEHLTLNADGSSKDIKFQANGVEKASISSAGAFTSTTIDATKLTGTIPNFTSTGIDDNADATAITITSAENVGIGTTSPASGRGIAGAVLHISDTPDAALRITDTGGSDFEISAETNTTLGTIDNTALNIITNNTNRMTVGNDGVITNTGGVYNTTPTTATATGWNFNNGGATITCTQNTAVKIGDCGASGMLIINDTTLNGQINILLTGAGSFSFLGASSHFVNSSSPNTSQVGFYRDSNQIYVKNGKSSTVQLGLLTFRTRNAQ